MPPSAVGSAAAPADDRVELTWLPFDRRRPPAPSYRRLSVSRSVAGDVASRLLGPDRRDIAPLATWLAALQAVLFRYGRQERTTIAAADDSLHATWLPIVSTWSDAATITGHELTLQVHAALATASPHTVESLRDLQETAGVPDPAFGRRLFNVALFRRVGDAAGTEPLAGDLDAFVPQCDLVVTVTEGDSQTVIAANCDADLFEHETVERLLGHLETLVAGLVADPQTPVARLDIMTSAEQQRFAEMAAALAPPSETATLPVLFERQVSRSPHAPAVTCGGITWSYRQLSDRAGEVAAMLRTRGAGRGTLVGICLERSLDLVAAIIGILETGAAYVPIDPSYPSERIQFIVADARLELVLTATSLEPRVAAPPGVAVCLDRAAVDHGHQATNATERPAADDVAYVIYTSGTTGRPKGSLITHRSVTRLFQSTADWFGFAATDVWTLFHSVAFDFSVWELWGPLLHGGRLVVIPFEVSRSPEAFHSLVASEGVTVLNQTPSAFRQFMAADAGAADTALSLRYVVFGGEALDLHGLRPWFERHGDRTPTLINMYGITETTVHVTYRPLSITDVGGGSVIGHAIPDLSTVVLDPLQQPTPIGVPGELYVSGPGLAVGYLNRPELTAERFPTLVLPGSEARRFYRTGDVVRRLSNGELEYLGRIDNQVKIRGFRIELGEVEAVLASCQEVSAAVVAVREDEPGVRRLIAYLVPAAGDIDVDCVRAHAARLLPDFMVPSTFVAMTRLPMTPHGKVDRAALPSPEASALTSRRQKVAARSSVEARFETLWRDILRTDQIGIDDNFFELGGDSILALQVVAGARRAGLTITPTDMFTHPTIAGLAVVARVTTTKAAEAVTGEAPLSPIQRWWFEQNAIDRNHYNQAWLFDTATRLTRPDVQTALDAVAAHHDALRLRFSRRGGGWSQSYAPEPGAALLDWIDLSGLDTASQTAAIAMACEVAHESLDIEQGPLWKVVYFDQGEPHGGQLFVVVHHLAVDGVSWRPLMEDIELAYTQASTGSSIRLPARTTSFGAWTRQLEAHAHADATLAERGWWQTQIAGVVPVRLQGTEADAVPLAASLTAVETDALLRQVPTAYNTQINDVLITALARAWARWCGETTCAVTLEGHGREALFDDVDLSRTVGWFTSMYPVRIAGGTVEPRWHPGPSLRSVKEQLRAIPRRGIGFGLLRHVSGQVRGSYPPVVFNYLGQVDQMLAGSSRLKFAPRQPRGWRSPRQPRAFAFELECLVLHGCLRLEWRAAPTVCQPERLIELSQLYLEAIRELIAHCTLSATSTWTPSDFPLARLSDERLQTLLAEHPDAEDIYSLSPIQSLFLSAEPVSLRAPFDQWQATLRGSLDVDAFVGAWRDTIARHASLRSTVHGRNLDAPLQVVHRRSDPPWTIVDARTGDCAAVWRQLLDKDLAQPLPVDQSPAMRFTLVRFGDREWRLLWSAPSLLVDGWSWPIVFADAAACYDARLDNRTAPLPAAPQYRDYIAWLAIQVTDSSRAFWRQRLAGVREPSSMVARSKPAAGAHDFANITVPVARTTSDALATFARQQRVTLNAVVQAAWALVVRRHSGTRNVVFGAAFSGRPSDLKDSDRIVGPFVNNLPVALDVSDDWPLARLVSEMHSTQVAMAPHQFLPLAEIRRCCSLPASHRLFESLVVFQNYRVDGADSRFGSTLAVDEFVGPMHTNYPVLVLAEPVPVLALTLIVDTAVVDATRSSAWARDLSWLLEHIAARQADPVANVIDELSVPAVSRPRVQLRAAITEGAAASTATERSLAGIWAELFGVDRVGIDSNFFDLGGHSLLVTELQHRVEQRLSQALPLMAVFEHPTIRGLARVIDQPAAPTGGHNEVAMRARKQRAALSAMRARATTRS